MSEPGCGEGDGEEAQLEAERARSAGYLDLLQHVQADFENFKRRAGRERERAVEAAVGDTLALLLPAVDHLAMALAAAGAGADDLRRGVELTLKKLLDDLAAAGVEPIPAAGLPFDPARHEAMLRVPGEPEGVVVAELRRGYVHRGRVLRPALVSVGALADDGAAPADDGAAPADDGAAPARDGTEGGSEA